MNRHAVNHHARHPTARANRIVQPITEGNKTPKALANLSPGFEQARTLGSSPKLQINPERVCLVRNPFRVLFIFVLCFFVATVRS
jgi:hypothetical protein